MYTPPSRYPLHTAYESRGFMPQGDNYGSALGGMQYVSPQPGYVRSAANPQQFYPHQPPQQSPVQPNTQSAPVQNQSWYPFTAQAQYQSSENQNRHRPQNQYQSPHQFHWAQAPEQVQDNPFAALIQRTPQTLWRSKLIYSAVECEFEGAQLKEPPFPFYQCWDEDAEHVFDRGKKRSRDEYEYEEDDDDGDEPEEDFHGEYDYDEEPAMNPEGFCCDFHMVHGPYTKHTVPLRGAQLQQ
jgi:hypothetical protein